jgi:hypothetical protein
MSVGLPDGERAIPVMTALLLATPYRDDTVEAASDADPVNQ